ncbi:hypothetical protein GP486_001498 [Trichoglossum hirsutum]|uniref:Uncharacterized protein n=1 Tax=Trichoglossum hirsutum TaxID=265104 RepID=A0A9P8LH17_9PEZI|nr:hypothetical protein GP486_001498 [Trichoglossum hirsutum]
MKSRYRVTLERKMPYARKYAAISSIVDTSAEGRAGNAERWTIMGIPIPRMVPATRPVNGHSRPVRTLVPDRAIPARTVLPANSPAKCAADIAGVQSYVVSRALLARSNVDGAVITAVAATCPVRFPVTLSLAFAAARRS